ncbi:hypothetical protein G5B37_12600 [Rasiella rasia]|uniref:Uncharacterized protein n=1 Tax=Rasiella rasia TaxID=2744027 RepID=A0A6G6GP94_9FLAO|nr:hypothetical protein [Rasiella rasia]QIE60372.1 hypothetical protein G5B37_12600 [Rasiella rasia]
MFKRIVTHKGYWKSVLVLSLVYGVIMYVIQWGFKGRWTGIFQASFKVLAVFVLGSFIVGFAITYGKFWRKLKEQEYRK